MKIRVIDLETGPDPDETSNGVIEIGWTDVIALGRDLLGQPYDWVVGETYAMLINPINPIPYEAMGIHHITDEMVRGKRRWNEAVADLFSERETADIVAYAAHNIESEQKYITSELTGDKPWICTFQTALHLYPEALSHSNQSLKYMLRAPGYDSLRSFPVHRGGPDSYVTAVNLAHMLNQGNSVERLVRLTEEPAVLYWCRHRRWRDETGKPIPFEYVDSGYLNWMLGPDKDFSRNEKHTATHILEQREIDQRIERERRELARQFARNMAANEPPKPLPDPAARPFAPVDAYEGR